MKTLRVTEIGDGFYVNEIIEDGRVIDRYMSLKECECMSVDGSFMFYSNENNAEKLKDYRGCRERARERAEMDERSYNIEVARHLATEVADNVEFAAREWSPELFHAHLMNELNTFFAMFPTKGRDRKRKIEEIRAEGQAALEGLELVYRDEPGVTGEQENR